MNFGGISIGHGTLLGQVGYLLGGLFLSLTGMALLYTQLYWRRRALTLEAQIVGVRQAGLYIHTVYQFVLPSGEIHQATCGQGSTSLQGRDTGRRVLIRVMPDRPDEVQEPGSMTIWALTIGSLAAGAGLTWLALTSWPATFLMWVVLAGVAFYLGSYVANLLKSQKSLVAQGRVQGEAKWSSWPVRPVEELIVEPPRR